MTNDDAELYGSLGRTWWEQTGAECKASAQQIKFAAARHNGATRAQAAALAGYSGSPEGLRSAGSRADDSKAVEDLLTFAAAAEAGATDNPVTVSEVKRKIGKLVRSPDGAIALKASELFVKLDAAEKQRGESPEDDGFGDWRVALSFLTMENGASQFMLFYKAIGGDMGHPGNYPLLHDVYHLAQREPFGQQIFDWCGASLNEPGRKALQDRLADPSYQLEARQKIWGEINKTPPGPFDPKLTDWRAKGLAPVSTLSVN